MSSPVFRYDIEQNTGAWTNARLGMPTASEMHRIITPKTGKLSTQAKPYRNRLLAEWILGRPVLEEAYESEYMAEGHDKEQGTVESFEFMTGLETKPVGIVTAFDGLVGCSPDRLIVTGSTPTGTLEVKSPAPQTHIHYLLEPESLVEKYRIQIQAQLWICEFDSGWAHADCRPLPPIQPIQIGRDEQFIGQLQGAVLAFLEDLHRCRQKWVERFGEPAPPKVWAKPERPAMTPEDLAQWGVSMEDLVQ